MPGSDEQVTVTDEVINDQEVVTDEINLDNPEEKPEIETEVTEELEETETEEEFTTDDLDLSENETTFSNYDLSKYKDVFDYDNIEAMEGLKEQAKEMENRGFTQDQVEYILDSIFQLNQEIEAEQEPKKITKAEVEENLKKYLTPEERHDYRTVNNYVKDIVKGTEFEGLEKNIMTDPLLVKFARVFYKKSIGGKVINKSNIPEQKTNVNYTVENAQAKYDKYLKDNPNSNRDEKIKFLTEQYKKMPEKEKPKFESIFDGLFNK